MGGLSEGTRSCVAVSSIPYMIQNKQRARARGARKGTRKGDIIMRGGRPAFNGVAMVQGPGHNPSLRASSPHLQLSGRRQ